MKKRKYGKAAGSLDIWMHGGQEEDLRDFLEMVIPTVHAFMYKYTDRLGNTENRCLTIWHRPYERFADDTSEWEALGNGE